ncbi:hypothetical protein GCM10022415_01970 [Knoellia locipacati]|uniref:Uncharacterized protein n=1 Tax=Knoellia locipacati TaxID=882824 RepID=A0A512SW27_9MICO|nr:hypothetical protein [Knoellia locipacati]GEQ12150.1 hypothetical protein KLO01_01970 [Knoellia locipacati]
MTTSDGPSTHPTSESGAVHRDLVEAVGSAILSTAPSRDPLVLVEHTASAEAAVRDLLSQAVGTARADGHSWAAIGAVLGMSRQAVQQRFGGRGGDDELEPEERWLGPVTAFDEMAELELAGRLGWHTIGVGMLRHRMVRTPHQWEHKRVLWSGSLTRWEKDDWVLGSRAFPWVYLVRDTGLPAEE